MTEIQKKIEDTAKWIKELEEALKEARIELDNLLAEEKELFKQTADFITTLLMPHEQGVVLKDFFRESIFKENN